MDGAVLPAHDGEPPREQGSGAIFVVVHRRICRYRSQLKGTEDLFRSPETNRLVAEDWLHSVRSPAAVSALVAKGEASRERRRCEARYRLGDEGHRGRVRPGHRGFV